MSLDPLGAFRLDGRTAVVTGASAGLGVRFARVLHAAGANVVMAARRLDRVEDLAGDLEGSLAVGCDVTDDADCERLVETALEAFGAIDVLVNNAGRGGSSPAEHEEPSDFRDTIEVNLIAPFVLSQLAGRHMLERGSGSIVNVASVLGIVGAGQIPMGSYATSKGGLVQMTRELAGQWARRGVRVNCLAPGWFESEMTAEMFADESSANWIRRKSPMGRAGHEGELDGALLFLASDASSYVTGQVIAVDGGWTAV